MSNIGGAERFEYTLIGDAVNEAARLTELAKGEKSGLLASATALEGAADGEAAHWQAAEEVELGGRSQATRLARPRD